MDHVIAHHHFLLAVARLGLRSARPGYGSDAVTAFPHGGDAHGRERNHRRIAPLSETWERKMQRRLPAAAESGE